VIGAGSRNFINLPKGQIGALVRLTVIIPTRERGEVLHYAMKSVLAQDFDGLELLVSDNASTDDTRDIVHAFCDPRVRYVNTGRRLSMSHNWEFALSQITGGWVMVIGDDDGLVPGALDRVRRMASDTGVKAMISTFVTFIWPNPANQHSGRLLVPLRRGLEVRETRPWMKRVVEGRGWYSDLPMLYVGGAADFELIRRIRDRRGTFFQSAYPDIFSSMALSSVTDRYVFSHEPLGIAGHSRHSNGASWTASGKGTSDQGKLKPSDTFLGEQNIPLHESLPLLPDGTFPVSGDLLVWESYQQARYLHGDPFGIDPADELALFRARKVADQDRMDQWITLFAQRHGLPADHPGRNPGRVRRRVAMDDVLQKARAFRDIYRLEPSFGVRMHDVYEASLVAGTILMTRPSRIRSYARTILRRLKRGRSGGRVGRAPSPST
jgi:hypothetical protein